MTFSIEATGKAKRDLDTILKWLLAEGAGEAGLRWFQGLRNAVASLAEVPSRCPFAPENEIFPFEVRQLVYGTKPHFYRILFTIKGDTVTVLSIRHGRRLHLTPN